MKIKLINGEEIELPQLSLGVVAHFENPGNCTKEIIGQFNDSIYKGFVTPDDKIILDIGANVGLFALHVSPYAEKIICVEPTPGHVILQKELIPLAIHEQSAISNVTGNSKFYCNGANSTMNSFMQERGEVEIEVNTITLKDLCEKYELSKVNFCKIDIEGSEWRAITEETMKAVFPIIDKVFIELHPGDGSSQETFKKIFESVGYKVDKVVHDTLFCYK